MAAESIQSVALDRLAHGFFSRRGGVSEGQFASLNCGERSSDRLVNVAENRKRVATALELEPDRLVTAVQTHSTDVEAVTSVPKGKRPKADGLVTNLPGVAVAVLTADCQPVLLADRDAGVVSAVHAGWPGTLGGIIENAIRQMERLGALRNRIAAAIGPAISQENYEVGPEFKERFIVADSGSEEFFRIDDLGKLRFDLPGYGARLLERSGVGSVDRLHHCTYADEERFFSYRRSCHRNEKAWGLLISAIANG